MKQTLASLLYCLAPKATFSIEEGGNGKKPYDKKTFFRRIPKLINCLRAVAFRKSRDPHVADDAAQMAVVNILVKYDESPEFVVNDSYALNAAARAVHEIMRSESRRDTHETACGRWRCEATAHPSDVEAMVNEARQNAEIKKPPA